MSAPLRYREFAGDASLPGETETISGGTGDDIIVSVDGVEDDIDCGSGNDAVAVDPIDKVAPNCETRN